MEPLNPKEAKIAALRRIPLKSGVTIVQYGAEKYCVHCLNEAPGHLQKPQENKRGYRCPRCKRVLFLNPPTVLGLFRRR